MPFNYACTCESVPLTAAIKLMITRTPAVATIADCTDCEWPSRSSKVDNFYFIWKGVCHFLLVTNSNVNRISHRFQDMVSFPLKNAHFSYPGQLNPEFENIPLELNRWNFACLGLWHMANYSCKNFPYDYRLTIIHPWQTDRRTDGQRTTQSYQ